MAEQSKKDAAPSAKAAGPAKSASSSSSSGSEGSNTPAVPPLGVSSNVNATLGLNGTPAAGSVAAVAQAFSAAVQAAFQAENTEKASSAAFKLANTQTKLYGTQYMEALKRGETLLPFSCAQWGHIGIVTSSGSATRLEGTYSSSYESNQSSKTTSLGVSVTGKVSFSFGHQKISLRVSEKEDMKMIGARLRLNEVTCIRCMKQIKNTSAQVQLFLFAMGAKKDEVIEFAINERDTPTTTDEDDTDPEQQAAN